MKVQIKVPFLDKDTKRIMQEKEKADYSEERAKFLYEKGFVTIIEEKEEPIIKKKKQSHVSKQSG